ncbi:MAG: DUF7344 domain-containing protein [Halobacteriota archaeon]
MNSQSGQAQTDKNDLVFETLCDRYRRHILCLLAESDSGPGKERYDLDRRLDIDADSETIRTALHHTHLPRLADAGYIEWDRKSSSIARGPQFDEIKPVVTLLDEHRDRLPSEWP